jgi:hypothetical protein
MKYKLKEIDVTKLTNVPKETPTGTILNVFYDNSLLEFQTPVMLIQDITSTHLVVKLLPTKASDVFYTKMLEIENKFKSWSNCNLESVFERKLSEPGDTLNLKINVQTTKIYKDNSLFNFYHLTKNSKAICLVRCDKIWKTDKLYYNLKIKELLLVDT